MNFLNVFRNIILLFFVATVSAFSQGYEIKISLNKSNSNDTVLLGFYSANRDRLRSSGSCVLDKAGRGVFKGEEKLPKGMYFIAMNGQKLLDFLIGDEQKFEIQLNPSDMDKTTIKGSRDNDIFFEFIQLNRNAGMRQQELRKRLETADSINRIKIHEEQRELHSEQIINMWKKISESEGLYVHKYLNAQFPVNMRVPSANPVAGQVALPKDASTWTRDSISRYQYRWYRANFFSDINIFDPDMIRTPFHEDKVIEYITGVVPQITDSICIEIDKLMTKALGNELIFRAIIVPIYNYYSKKMTEVLVDKGVVPENVWVHITEKWYIPYAKWSTDEHIETLKEQVVTRSPTLIGKLAPHMKDFVILPPEHFKAAALDTAIKYDLHAGIIIQDFRKDLLKTKFTVLYFWDFTCGHCKKSIQELFALWEESEEKGMQVITIQQYLTERRDKGKWIDFVNENNLFGNGWFNGWSPYNHDFRKLYDTANIPKIYLLDENGVIIFRNIGLENLKEIFKSL